jgi:hypothetical protein
MTDTREGTPDRGGSSQGGQFKNWSKGRLCAEYISENIPWMMLSS